jgi:D-alanyl-D-alanine carboxypeptidase
VAGTGVAGQSGELERARGRAALRPVRFALGRGRETLAVRLAARRGLRDRDRLTDMVFRARHPELRRRPHRRRPLIREWVDIRRCVVEPALAPSVAPEPAAPLGPDGGEPAEPTAPQPPGEPAAGPAEPDAAPAEPQDSVPGELALAFMPTPVESPGGGRIGDKRDPRPQDIVTVQGVSRPIRLHRLAARAWSALVAEARRAGLAAPLLSPTSGYRSRERQARLFARAVRRYGSREAARRWVAPPGASPHQSGRALDLYLGGRNDSSNVARLRTLPAYRWLAANARRFGFYPYEREPWHWEYNPPARPGQRLTDPEAELAMASGDPITLARAMAAGERNENRLTDAVFFARHPERGGRRIERGEHALAKEWLTIRNTIVRPALTAAQGGRARPTPSRPSARIPRRGRDGGRRPGLAKEHVIVVGAPSNFYNGFGRFDASGNFVLNPPPKDLAGVRDFCHPSLGNVTHDLYWANFIEPVPRLFTQRIAKPTDGDIVTILVYWPPYAERSSVDWDSSPWNGLAWRNSPWVAGKDPYDPMVRLRQQGTLRAPSIPTTPRVSKTPIVPFPKQPAAEARINHEILMRCTTEAKRPGQTYDMRPSRADEWMDDVHDLARRIVFGPMLAGAPVLPAVLVKLLIVDDPKLILNYLTHGTFPSDQRWTHLLDTRTEEDMAKMGGPPVGAREGQWWDATAAPKKGFKPPPYWTAPHISRKQVSVKRLDYIGHSNEDAFFLKYGWANGKGDPGGPIGEVVITTAELDAALKAAPQPVFAPSARAHLWGCSLGLGMAQTLSNHVATIAAEVLTDYEGLVLDPKAMPTPIGGGWITYVKPITVRVRP